MNTVNISVNLATKAAAFPTYRNFIGNISRARQIQERLLLGILRRNASTAFGVAHGFKSIDGVEKYRQSVPVRSYEEHYPYIERIARGEENVLYTGPTRLLEPTGGSTGGTKLIPYNTELKKEFRRAIYPWLYDIYREFPSALRGESYWSISPRSDKLKPTEGGIPVGFDDDSEYLGITGRFLSSAFAVPPQIKHAPDIETFRRLTAYYLLRAADLTIISVWNPTFLSLILDYIGRNKAALIKDIYDGLRTSLPCDDDEIELYSKPNRGRARELENEFAQETGVAFNAIWKRLRLISCWKDGPSHIFAEKLKQSFPGIPIQGKGLIATEGIVSLPLFAVGGCVPAYNSHFLEFRQKDEETPLLINELTESAEYRVIITTGGGLYRYNLGDIVRVTGFYRGLPLLEFVGRDRVVDIFGEKLNEIFVGSVVAVSLRRYDIRTDFAMIAPNLEDNHGFYVLFLGLPGGEPNNGLSELGKSVEAGLNKNFHYHYARDLGQLKPLRVFLITENAASTYNRRRREEGQTPGDIKPAVLDGRTDWLDYFDGAFFNNKRGAV